LPNNLTAAASIILGSIILPLQLFFNYSSIIQLFFNYYIQKKAFKSSGAIPLKFRVGYEHSYSLIASFIGEHSFTTVLLKLALGHLAECAPCMQFRIFIMRQTIFGRI
jgi:hypothetical protein